MKYLSIAMDRIRFAGRRRSVSGYLFHGSGNQYSKNHFCGDQPFVKNEKANEAVMAFNFFKTVDEIAESQALDTDLRPWANARDGAEQ